jgi:hypothetical protein
MRTGRYMARKHVTGREEVGKLKRDLQEESTRMKESV